MSDLVVVTYDNELKADEMRVKLLQLQKDYLVSLGDAVVVIKDKKGKVKLRQLVNLPLSGAAGGSFWGVLIGILFLHPLLGLAVGAAAGAVSGALTDVGIDDKFMKNLAADFQPGTSALCVLVEKVTVDKVMDALRGTGGHVLKTSLSHEDETRLQAVLDGKIPPAEETATA